MDHWVGQQGFHCKHVRSGSVQLHATLSSCSLPRCERQSPPWFLSVCGCRDFKPENLLLRTVSANETNLNQPLSVGDLQLRLIDFGSAVDKHSIEQLYGSEGPSDDEQTAEYAPPEALLARYVIFVCCQQQIAVHDFP